ncbi:GNAT family N-acetyltransferase [Enterococcus sp. LJL99]
MILETERLILREWRLGEEKQLQRFLGSDKVMYAYEGAFDDKQIKAWLKWNLQLYEEKGYGLWAIERKSDGAIIGECGLIDQNVAGQDYVEIGYHLNSEFWKNGYMIEAANAVKAYAFTVLKTNEVVSIIRDTNIASMNVAIRNGMIVLKRFIKHYRGIDMPHYLFIARKTR